MASFVKQISPCVFHIVMHVKPGARTSSVACVPSLTDTALEVRVGAAAVDGQANKELIDFVESTLTQRLRELGTDRVARLSQTQSYKALTHARSVALLAPVPSVGSSKTSKRGIATTRERSKKTLSKNGGGNESHMHDMNSHPSLSHLASATHVSVTLKRGFTARVKTVEVTFPGTLEELVGILELAASEE